MYEHKKIQALEDFFTDISRRRENEVYFYRINAYNASIHEFIVEYYKAARCSGVILEGKLQNPDEKQLSYYEEMLGMEFILDQDFFLRNLQKWMPRVREEQCKVVAETLHQALLSLRQQGKNDNILKNAYIKFMCWLYYKLESLIYHLGEDKVPKILYEGDISSYELLLFSVLSGAGCDIVLLQYHGDTGYQKLDSASVLSDSLVIEGGTGFPEGFCIQKIRQEMTEKENQERLYGDKPQVANCTNAWISGNGFEDILKSVYSRGNDTRFFYNCFYRINGVEDKLTYENQLYQLQLSVKKANRRVVIIENELTAPTPEEIAGINRKHYEKVEQLVQDLAFHNIKHPANRELERIMVKAFVDVVMEECHAEGMNLNKLTNRTVYLLCWLKRYQTLLFSGWEMPQVACFFYLGCCRDSKEAMFLRFLARLPVDVVILNSNLNQKCVLEDKLLYEITFRESLSVSHFPQGEANAHIGTVAFHAERELDQLMYQDTGIYRNQQYAKANTINLQTMYEEIYLLWNEELRYRPGFSTVDDVVNLPVICAKVSGVKDGQLAAYWSDIRKLLTENTLLIKDVPYITSTTPNPMKQYALEFYKNGRLQKSRIKEHPKYPYGFLREEMQDYMLDKLQTLIEQKSIKGIGQNGTEYTVIATVLNLHMDILRMIQKIDFTKKNPKLVWIVTGENSISLEDSILAAYLNLIGFDILFFVPTGYQSVERHFTGKLMEEHQTGSYMYDLQVPDLKSVSGGKTSWIDKILKRHSEG